VAWWAGSYDSRNSPLGRLLFAQDGAGNVAASGTRTPSDRDVFARLEKLAETAGPGRISVERAALGAPAAWSPPPARPAELEVSPFDRSLDLRWRRTSYSDITAASHDAWVTSEPEQPLLADEPDAAAAPPLPDTAAPQLSLLVPSPLADMPAGVDVGTFVHGVMELTDFAAPDLKAELAARIAEMQARRAVDVGPVAALTAGLEAVITTPLGPVLGGAALRDVARGDRLSELGFELPLAGGDRPSGWLTVSRIASVLREHAAAGDPFHGYADRLGDPRLRRSVRGYLTGSLDLVVRIPGLGGDRFDRFAVLDYKTNWLGAPDEPLTAWHYRPEALEAEMLRHHYALQALLYSVALHRFLRWRLPGYDPDRHLAGVVYLFVRGMVGTDASSGVFGWSAPPGLVPALSDALSEGAD
jgi:exodeoxyribonuclease V beta subunit